MKTGAVIQARMGSTRFPEKILKQLNDKTVLQHIVNRVCASRVEKTVVATTKNRQDDIVEEYCAKYGIACFRGSENDVLERFYFAARQYGFDVIVRITADDPLKDTQVIDRGIELLVQDRYDYVSNTIHPTYPEGIDVEVFTFAALEKAFYEAALPSEREHVTPYIWKNQGSFRCFNFEYKENLSAMRWTMDTEDDYEFMKAVYAYFVGRDNFSMEEVLGVLRENPDILKINQGHIRNEGYLKSVRQEEDDQHLWMKR